MELIEAIEAGSTSLWSPQQNSRSGQFQNRSIRRSTMSFIQFISGANQKIFISN